MFASWMFAALLCAVTPAHALEVNRFKLGDGLVVLHVERHNLPIVVANLLIKSGSAHEPADKAGLAQFVASMLKEGTNSRDASALDNEIEFLGASLGASADKDYSTLSLTVLKKDIGKGFELFSDVLLNPTFPESELSRKITLAKGALMQNEENPEYVGQREFMARVFGGHPYGWLTSGSKETIENIKRDDLVEFYSKNYVPGNAILSVVGDISKEELKDLLKRHMKGWKGKAPARAALGEPAKPAPSMTVIDRDITQANILIGHLGVGRLHPDYYAIGLMNYILGGGGFSSRLMASIRDEMGLTYGIYSGFDPELESGQFVISVQTRNESAGAVIDEIKRQVDLIRTEPVTEQELQNAKDYMTGSFPRRLETMGRIAGFLTQVEFYGLGLNYIEDYPRLINSVTREDILRVARQYITPEGFVTVIVADKAKAGLDNE